MLKKTNYILALMSACALAAVATVGILSFAAQTARVKVSDIEIAPDYVRYLSQGYAFETVSTKKSYLLTVTDGELPVRAHIFTIDETKHTLDVLDLPPDTFAIADGFSGTLRDAFKTPVYKDIVSMMFCLKIDGAASFSAETLGDCAQLLGVCLSGEAKKITLDGFDYSALDADSVADYHRLLADILTELSDRGALESFTVLMNLIANRVDTSMTVSDIASAVSSAKGIEPKKMNIYIVPGFAAKFGEGRIWVLNSGETAELLNRAFRVKGVEYQKESLSIPEVECDEFPYGGLPVRVSDIKDTIKEEKYDRT